MIYVQETAESQTKTGRKRERDPGSGRKRAENNITIYEAKAKASDGAKREERVRAAARTRRGLAENMAGRTKECGE